MEKKFFIKIILKIVIILIFTSSLMFIIDPYFHYHKPLKGLYYSFLDQRYINNGIIKNFEYDGIIIGTSMTENFKTSQFNNLFKVKSIKVPFAGGSPKEISDNLEYALKRKKELKLVLRSVDYSHLLKSKDQMNYNDYPKYLYDDIIFNDYRYLLNKTLLVNGLSQVIISTLNKKELNFDEYSNWNNSFKYGKNNVLKNYVRVKEKKEETLNEIEKNILIENIEENFLKLPKLYPKTKYIYFITPYSILYWDNLKRSGTLKKQFEIEKIFLEKVLKIKNIEIYSFFNNYSLITDLDNYKDPGHYSGKINELILIMISQNNFRLTEENYKNYLENNFKFYNNYNYKKIFE